MQVFKLFYKIMQANKIAIIAGFALLMAITIPINIQFENSLSNEFEYAETSLTIYNHDEESVVTQHLVDYLDESTNIVEVADEAEALADAFYDAQITYALTIPSGFGEGLIGPEAEYIPLEKEVVQSEMDEANVDAIITSYLTNARVLSAGIDADASEDQIDDFLVRLSDSVDNEVEILPTVEENGLTQTMAFSSYYTTYAAYILTTTFITVFGYAVIAMRNPEIVKRDRMSMMTEGKRLAQTLLGCISFSFLYWIILMVVALILYGPSTLFSTTGLLVMASSLISTFGIQAMAYFLVTIATSRGMITFLATFISLFIAFASGLFVPREFVSPVMQQIASIATPIWQVRANEVITSSTQLSGDHLTQILIYFGIMVLIGLAYYALSFVIQSYRQRNSIYM